MLLTPQLLTQEEPLPTACDPSDVTHGYVPIRVEWRGLPWGQGVPGLGRA